MTTKKRCIYPCRLSRISYPAPCCLYEKINNRKIVKLNNNNSFLLLDKNTSSSHIDTESMSCLITSYR